MFVLVILFFGYFSMGKLRDFFELGFFYLENRRVIYLLCENVYEGVVIILILENSGRL